MTLKQCQTLKLYLLAKKRNFGFITTVVEFFRRPELNVDLPLAEGRCIIMSVSPNVIQEK